MTEPGTSRQPGTVCTFYSFKGGVGRSMALANVAVLLARWGKRVLAIDFDLEAPGLEKYFAEYIPADRGRRDVPGLIDLITEFGAGREATWRDHLIRATVPDGTCIDLLTAGRADLDYVSRLGAIDWHELFEEHRFGEVLEDMRSEWIAAYDFVLVDSRTGFTDIGGICTIHLPDVLVTLFTANHQNLEGVKEVMQRARRSHRELPFERSRLLVLPVPARDETDNEYELAAEWRTRFAAELKELFDDWVPQTQSIDELLNFVKLPYFPYWSFGERLPVLREEASNPKTLAGSFAFLAKLVLHRLDWDQAVSGDGAAAGELAAIEARLREARQAETDARSEISVRSPYRGLRPFLTDDAAVFFGRDAEVHDIVRRLDAGEREIYVVGPSGCGKSSLICAGVLPRLARGASGLRPFVIRTMRPGADPTRQLAEALDIDLAEPVAGVQAALARVAEGASLLLVIDQLEEVFALASPAARTEFTSVLGALRADPRCVLLGVLRADHVGAFLDSPFWVDLVSRSARIDVGPLRREALREIITGPARARGVDFEPELVERLLGDAALEPGSLPFIQDTLLQLWENRRGSRITLADYEALGGADRSAIAAAISSRAAAALHALSPHQLAIARRILLRLVSFGEGRANTRRQQPVLALRTTAEDAGEFDKVLDQLVASRVLTIDAGDAQREPRVDLAHEILIDAWPTMTEWIAELRAGEERRRRLEAAARDWVERGRSADRLLGATALAELEAWRTEAASPLEESADLAELVTASQAAREQARRRQRRVRLRVLALATSTALFAAGVVLSTIQAHRASNDAERSLAQSRHLLAGAYQEIGRQLLLDGRAAEAVPYLVAARQSGEDGWPLRLLFGTSVGALPVVPVLEQPGFVYTAAFSPDGTRVVTAGVEQTAHLWDARTGQQIASFPHGGAVYSAAFSADGMRVVTASADHTAQIWDSATGRAVGRPLEHPGVVHGAAFSLDGKRIVTASNDPAARVWDAGTGKLVATLLHDGPQNAAIFSPDGTRIVTASDDRTARIWNAATHALLVTLSHGGPVTATAFSPDGTRVVTASRDNTARIWDAATGKPVTAPLVHGDAVSFAVFSPDGTRIATASTDHTARVWDSTGKPVTAPLVHGDTVASIAFSSDGTRVITASADHTAQIWSAVTGKPLYPVLEHPGAVGSAAFSPDGMRVVTASADHTRIWSAMPGVTRSLALDSCGRARTAAFSPDGQRVSITDADGAARICDAATGTPIAELPRGAKVVAAAFSPDGTRLVTASDDRTARIWSAATGVQVMTLSGHTAAVSSAAFSSDGMRIVTASADGTAGIWNAATGEQVMTLSVMTLSERTAAVSSAAFNPDGKRIVTASADGVARIWNTETGVLIATLRGHEGAVNTAVFSPGDGSRLVTASDDNTARVWDAATGRPPIVLRGHQGRVSSAAFSPDGACIVTASADGTARMWDTATGRPLSFPLEHKQSVVSVAFSPDCARLLTAGAELRIWALLVDRGPLRDWSAAAERSAFVLVDGVFSPRTAPPEKSPEIDPPGAAKDH